LIPAEKPVDCFSINAGGFRRFRNVSAVFFEQTFKIASVEKP
jgi:hypothetical protein